jgi:hypothetical protein
MVLPRGGCRLLGGMGGEWCVPPSGSVLSHCPVISPGFLVFSSNFLISSYFLLTVFLLSSYFLLTFFLLSSYFLLPPGIELVDDANGTDGLCSRFVGVLKCDMECVDLLEGLSEPRQQSGLYFDEGRPAKRTVSSCNYRMIKQNSPHGLALPSGPGLY